MPEYAAFLRGVSPATVKMPELRRAFEAAGFKAVRTLRSSGNVRFIAPPAAEATLERRAEAAMVAVLGRRFPAFVRPVEALAALIAEDPYRGCVVPSGAKRVVTFLRAPPPRVPRFPVERDGARIVKVAGREAFSAYRPSPRGPVFMALIEEIFGEEVTTRTWETVRRVAAGADAGGRAAPGAGRLGRPRRRR